MPATQDTSPNASRARNYLLAYLNGLNPLSSIEDQMSQNTEQMIPPPNPAAPPTPSRWWRNDEAHPLYPIPQGAPADFAGMVIPNPDNLRVLPDTQAPADVLSQGKLSTGNFTGKKTPLRKVSDNAMKLPPGAVLESAPATSQPAMKLPPGAVLESGTAGAAPPTTPGAGSRFGNNLLLGAGVSSNEEAKNFFVHPIDTLKKMATTQGGLGIRAKNELANKDYVRGLTHAVEYMMPMLGPNLAQAGDQLEKGDIAGGTGRTLGAAIPIVAGSPEARATAAETGSAISDTAQAAADRAITAAQKVTPKQAAIAAGTAGGAVIGKGVMSAYFGSKFGHVAEALLGKDRANAPIFQKAASLDEAADSLAEVIARDREAQTQAAPLGKLPATGAKPASATAEALAAGPQTASAAAKTSAPRFTVQDRAAAKSLLEDALQQHTSDVIDNAVPGKNTQTKGAIEYYLKKGDVANAERVLDKSAKAANPAWQPLDRQPVPSTNEIRERVQAESKIPAAGSAADALDDRALQQEMDWNLQRHGWAAESEARREFIARNSNYYNKSGKTRGYVPGETVKYTKTPGVKTAGKAGQAAGSASATAASGDLTDMLQKSLDQVRAQSEQK
jgi:hypothetical protein